MSYLYGSGTGIGVTRVNGDSQGIENMDIGIKDPSGYSSLGHVISTGIGKQVGAFKILVLNNSAVAQNLCGTQTKDPYTGTVTNGTNGLTTTPSETQIGGVVEAILKVLEQKVTVLAYQVGNGTGGTVAVDGGSAVTNQISVIFEQTAAWASANDSSSAPTVPLNDYGAVVLGLQQAIQALGSSVGINGTDVRGTLVSDAGLVSSGNYTFGTSITFA